MRVDARTSIFCVIGNPVEHSLSPAMHNAVFEGLGLNCVYTAFRVKPTELGSAVRGLKVLGVKGANITIPHKVAVIEHLDELSEEARIIGAVNTVKFGRITRGYNTDGIGALRALRKGGADPGGKKVLILGSGGAARAIAVTLALHGVSSLTMLGVIKEELGKLVSDVSKNTNAKVAGSLMNEKSKREEIAKADVLIHCTPVGMHPKVDETLATADMFRKNPKMKVMDIVYAPRETMLMKEAKKAGVKTIIGGLDMLVNQGAESLKIWLGIDAPLELMKKTVEKELHIRE